MSEREDVVITSQLARRPARAPDFAAESRALVSLARTMADRPGAILDRVVELALEIGGAQTAGISLVEGKAGRRRFVWHALAGPAAARLREMSRADFRPAELAIRRAAPQLFSRPGPKLTRARKTEPRTAEVLLIPLVVRDEPVAVLWLLSHDQRRRFDREHVRLMTSVGALCATAIDVAHRAAELESPLGRSEERLRRALQIETVGIISFDLDGLIFDANDAFLRMSGYSREDLAERRVRWDVMTPPEWMASSLEAVKELEALGRTTPYEKEYLRKDGSRWWALFAAKRVGRGEGVEFIIDITESKRTQEALRASEARFRCLVQNVHDYAIFMTDEDGKVTEWTEGAARVTGYAAEEIIGQHVSIFYPPEDVAAGEVERELQEAAARGRAERESWRVRKGGNRFWGNEISTAIRDSRGKLLGFTKISRDLSERKQMQDALRDSEERHRLLIDNVRDYAIFMTDPDGRIVTWGAGAQQVFGYREGEIVGRSGDVLFTPRDRVAGEHDKELATAGARGRASDDRWQVRKGGQRFWASGVTTAFRDGAGQLRGFVKICRDLTERKLLEDERERVLAKAQEARQAAEAATRMKDEFIATVSHELRTPLGSIVLWSKMLRDGGHDPKTMRKGIEAITRAASSQSQLIEDLLDVSRMISGKLRLEITRAPLGPVIKAAVDSVAAMASAKGVQIDVNLEAVTETAAIDPDRIQQVLWNLLTNAVKFTPEGGLVRVRLRRAGRHVEIEVTDTGLGMDPEFLPHVFERFKQADGSITRKHGGLGLGLAIVRQLVELHGGTVLASSPGKDRGSTFVVKLPVPSQSPARRPARPVAASGTWEPSLTLDKLRVLLVEDEQDTREAIRLVLQQSGAEVTAAASAAEAIAVVDHDWPDVLVSDIGMPGGDGYGLIRRLREIERERGRRRPLPATALTAYAGREDVARALDAGFHSHVAKPIEPDKLIAAIAQVVRPTARG